MRGTLPAAAQSAATAKLSIEQTCAALRPVRSGAVTSEAAVVSTFSRSAAEVAAVTRWPRTM
jgi:hypothetical protein